jgi:hypothetical protein
MPYRRLPNTDTSRLKAMKAALEKGKNLPPQLLAFSAKSTIRLEKTLPLFENNIRLYRQSVLRQGKSNQDYNDLQKKARLYLTHFIRVMNMAIFRGELTSETRTFYAIGKDDSTVPSLSTENELVSWGRRIIEGEEFRVRKGGNPVTNPSIAVVKVRFETFLEAFTFQKSLEKKSLETLEKNIELRHDADEIILQIWNEVENSHRNLPEEERMRLNEDYGIKYFYRKSELGKDQSIDQKNYR